MNFRDLCAATNGAVLDATGDDAQLDGRDVRILFAEPWIEPRLGTLRTDITQPMAYLPQADLQGVEKPELLSFNGQEYDVVAVEPDGTGWVGLVLRLK